MKTIIMLAALAILTGCATSADSARAYYDAQAAAQANQRPLIRMEAYEGKDIVLAGVKTFEVYAPAASGQSLTQYREAHHPVWDILGQTLRIAAPIYFAGEAAIGLADSVGRSVGAVATSPTVVHADVVTQPAPLVVQQPPYNDPILVPTQVIDQPIIYTPTP
jgi:hypothetical protein